MAGYKCGAPVFQPHSHMDLLILAGHWLVIQANLNELGGEDLPEDEVSWKMTWEQREPNPGSRHSMKSWLVNRDSYNGLWNNPHIIG